LLFTLGSLALHLVRLEDKGLWWDESLSVYRAGQSLLYILGGRIEFPGVVTIDQHPPLYFLLLHLLLRVGGARDALLYLPSLLPATLIVPTLYVLGARLHSPRAGLFAALWGALSPFYLWYAQEVRMYTLVTALGLLSFYLLWRALEEARWTWTLAYGLVAAAAAATQYLFVLLIPCQALLALLLWPRRGALREGLRRLRDQARPLPRATLGWGVLIPLLLVPLLAYWAVQAVPSLSSNRYYVPLPIMLRDALNSFSLGLSVALDQVWPLDVAFLAIYGLGLVAAWREPRGVALHGQRARGVTQAALLTILLATILFPIVFIWFFSLFTPIYMGSRYIIMSSPFFYLSLGIGLDYLARRTRIGAGVAVLVLGAGMVFSIYSYFTHPLYRIKEDYRAAARLVSAQERPGDVILVVGAESAPAFQHYYKGTLPVMGLPRGGSTMEEIVASLQVLQNDHDRLWLVRGNTQITDPQQRVMGWLDAHPLLLGRQEFPGYVYDVSLSSYLAHPLDLGAEGAPRAPLATWEDALALAEVTVRYRAAAGPLVELTARTAPTLPLTAGQSVAVAFSWRPLAPLDEIKTSLRLLDAAGTLWAQQDEVPYGYFPSSKWPLGSVIWQQSAVRVPLGTPPGRYLLQAWVYRAADGRPWRCRDASGGAEQPYLALGEVLVGAPEAPPSLRELLPAEATRPRWRSVYGETLALLGYQWDRPTARPGESLTLALYWQAERAPAADYQLVLNWQDDQGRIWHTATLHPAGTDYPTSRWQRGERVRGLLRVAVPADAPAGPQRLHLLMRRDEAAAPWLWLRQGPLPWAGRDLEVGRIVVEPGRP
jgi:uncharacterized membrane protein